MKKRITLTIVSTIALLFFAAGSLMAQPKTILFMTDYYNGDETDVNDDYNFEFLEANAGADYTITKFWPGSDITTWSQAMGFVTLVSLLTM